ncbi:hypothetical protein Tco_1432162, partial [Tanacetum coccineum]
MVGYFINIPKKHGDTRGAQLTALYLIKRDKKDIMMVYVYVDDIIFGSTNKSWCDEFEALMKSRFQMSSMAKILKKFDLVNVKAAITPMETKVALTKDEEAIDVDVHLYRSMIVTTKNFQYWVTSSTDCNRIFKYRKGKPNFGLKTIVATSTTEAEYVLLQIAVDSIVGSKSIAGLWTGMDAREECQ